MMLVPEDSTCLSETPDVCPREILLAAALIFPAPDQSPKPTDEHPK
jgi:hypothetical protein